MEKSKKYEKAIIDFFEDYIENYQTSQDTIKPELVIDKERMRYILLLIGWDESRFVYAPLFHFDIVNDKVWLQQNSTDLLITEDLLKRDIPKSDIVLGFKPQYARAFEGFGIA